MIYLACDDRYFILGVEALFSAINKHVTIIPLNDSGETVVIPELSRDDTLVLALEQADTLTRLLILARRHDTRTLLLMDNGSERALENISQWSQRTLPKKMPLDALPKFLDPHVAYLKDLSFLTQSEIKIMGSLAKGKTPYRLSKELNVSVKTIFAHKLNALKKLGLDHLNARSLLIFSKICQGLAPF